jgi:hypothetical protein
MRAEGFWAVSSPLAGEGRNKGSIEPLGRLLMHGSGPLALGGEAGEDTCLLVAPGGLHIPCECPTQNCRGVGCEGSARGRASGSG